MYSKCVFKALEKLAFPYSVVVHHTLVWQIHRYTVKVHSAQANTQLRLTKALSSGHYSSVHTLTLRNNFRYTCITPEDSYKLK